MSEELPKEKLQRSYYKTHKEYKAGVTALQVNGFEIFAVGHYVHKTAKYQYFAEYRYNPDEFEIIAPDNWLRRLDR